MHWNSYLHVQIAGQVRLNRLSRGVENSVGWNDTFNYVLGTGESYGPTAQHTQDSPIFFLQLNYVHK